MLLGLPSEADSLLGNTIEAGGESAFSYFLGFSIRAGVCWAGAASSSVPSIAFLLATRSPSCATAYVYLCPQTTENIAAAISSLNRVDMSPILGLPPDPPASVRILRARKVSWAYGP